MAAPDLPAVKAYLGDQGGSWDVAAITAALAAEQAAQARRCRVPASDAEWDPDLAEALCRRVAANLANRGVPLGVQPTIAEGGVATTRVGGLDREVRRLEAPFRKTVKG